MRRGDCPRIAARALSALLLASVARGGSLSGKVLDRDGNPVAGARVAALEYRTEQETLVDDTEGVEPRVLLETRTSPDGAFRLSPAASVRPFSVRIEAAGLPTALFLGPFDPTETGELDDWNFPAAARATGRVVDESNRPISGARVRLRADAETADSDVEFSTEAKSGADGSFQTAAAPEGFRSIEVRATGLVPSARTVLAAGAGGDERVLMKRGGVVQGIVSDPAGKPVAGAVVVADRAAARTDPLGHYVLRGVPVGPRSVEAFGPNDLVATKDSVKVRGDGPADVALRLTRSAAVGGSVIDAKTRKPISGVRIVVADAGGRFARATARRAARSDVGGRFRASGLEPGRYAVEAVRKGYVRAQVPSVSASVASPGNVSVALEPAASVAGRVVDEKKQPVRGARVRVGREPSLRGIVRRLAALSAENQGESISGPDGRFRIDGLAAAQGLSLEAAKTGLVTARRTGMSLKTGERVQNVELVLRSGIAGRGRVVDAKGGGIGGAEIRLGRREGRGGGRFVIGGGRQDPPNAVSAADGSFVLAGLEPGDYDLATTRSGFAPKTTTISVKPSAPNAWPPIVLASGVSLSGVVRDSRGAPIPGAQILAVGEVRRPEISATGPDGSFRVGDLVPGRAVMLAVSADGFASTQRSATPPAENLSIALDDSATIRGHVVDGSGAPITDFTISASPGSSGGRGFGGGFALRGPGAGGGPQRFHSAEGAFEFSGIASGTWSLHASAPGFRTGDLSGVSVGPGETKDDVLLSLKRGGNLFGKVLDSSSGVPLANAMVSWEPVGSSPGPAAVAARLLDSGGANVTSTDADGKFAFDGLPDGKVTLTATHPDYLEANRDADPDTGMEVQIPLGSGGTITGSVVGSDGSSPVAAANVSLNEEGDTGGGLAAQTTQADGNGSFVFDHLGAGRFRLSARSNVGTSTPKEIVLADNQRQDGVLLQIAAGAELDGTVTGLPAGQLGGVRVSATATGYRDATQTDDTGRFVLKNVPWAIVTLSASTSFLQGRSTSKTVEIADGTTELPVEIAFQGTSRLAGQVTRGGRPMGGLFVQAAPDPRDGSGNFSGQTDDGGRYALEGMNDEGYLVTVAGQGVSYRKSFVVSGDTNGDILLPGTALSGTVVDSSSGQPIEGATVQAENGQEAQSVALKRATTDSNGFYTVTDLDPGSYQVTARMTGYRMKTQPATVGADPAEIDFSLDKGSGAQIQVSDGMTGMPLGGVAALAFSADGMIAFQGTVPLDSTGTGEISSLAPGRYAIYVFSGGYAPRSIPAVDVPSQVIPITMTPGGSVQVRAAAAVTGRILDASGAAYLLSAFRLDGVVSASPPVTVWQHLAPGAYRFAVSTSNGDQSFPFTVAEGQVTTLVVQ